MVANHCKILLDWTTNSCKQKQVAINVSITTKSGAHDHVLANKIFAEKNMSFHSTVKSGYN